jgi:ABC-type dipeptide/oligopeptide/nickel transport system permease subunit
MELIRLLKRRPWGIAGAVILLAVILIGILAPVIAPHDYNEVNLVHRLQDPGGDYVLGTDDLGRDVFSRLVYGARPYVYVSLITTAIALVLGLLLGFISFRMGGKTHAILRVVLFILSVLASVMVVLFAVLLPLRIFQSSLSIPLSLRLLANIRVMGWVAFAVSLLSPIFLLSVYNKIYLAFSSRSGNVIIPIISSGLAIMGVVVGLAVLIVAPAGYYGYGVPPPTPEWGSTLSGAGRQYISLAPWMVLYPRLALILTLVGALIFSLAVHEIWFPRLVPPVKSQEKTASAPETNRNS